jgi:hypothetical protein
VIKARGMASRAEQYRRPAHCFALFLQTDTGYARALVRAALLSGAREQTLNSYLPSEEERKT